MKLKLLAAVCAFAIGSAASAQITETVTPLVPLSPSDQQILNVQQAERQIQANEQAVALEKARAAEKAARQRAAAQARQAKAKAEAKAAQQAKQQAAEAEAAAQKQKLQNYQDQMMQMDLESKRHRLRSQALQSSDRNRPEQGSPAAGNRQPEESGSGCCACPGSSTRFGPALIRRSYEKAL